MGYAISRREGWKTILSSFLKDKPEELMNGSYSVQVIELNKEEYDLHKGVIEKRNERFKSHKSKKDANADEPRVEDLQMNISGSDIDLIDALLQDDEWRSLMKMHNKNGWSSFSYCCLKQKEFFYKNLKDAIRRGRLGSGKSPE